METTEAIWTRRSVREFRADPVPDALIERVLGAAAQAPSAKNAQNWRFVVLTGERKAALVRVMTDALGRLPPAVPRGSAPNSARIMDLAPALVVVLNAGGLRARTWRGESPSAAGLAETLVRRIHSVELQSVAAAIENLLLAATDAGLGSLWICDLLYASEDIEEHLLPLTGRAELVAAVALGYPSRPEVRRADRDWRQVTFWPDRPAGSA